MKFCLISLIICLSRILFNEICLSTKLTSECLLTIETKVNVRTCLSSECIQLIDPIQILNNSCQLTYFKLSFTTDQTFLDFIENQFQSNYFLEQIFLPNDHQSNTIEIEIGLLNCTANEDFLSSEMFSYLGGENEIIPIFRLTIDQWIQTDREDIITIDENTLFEQPFQEIHLKFFCHHQSTLVQWILFKDQNRQENSPCPTQLQIQLEYSMDEDSLQSQSIVLYNKSIIHQQVQTTKKTNNSISTGKIIIGICLILFGICLCIYYFVYLPRLIKCQNNSIVNDDDDDIVDKPVSEASQNIIE